MSKAKQANRITLFSDGGLASRAALILLKYKGVEGIAVAKADAPYMQHHDVKVAGVIATLEYIDEAFPSPPMMPVYPAARAQCRMLMDAIVNQDQGAVMVGKLTEATPFINSDEISLVDIIAYARLSGRPAPAIWSNRVQKELGL